MKYAVLLCRGISKNVFSDNKNDTPLCSASIPFIDSLAAVSETGLVQLNRHNIPEAFASLYSLLGFEDERAVSPLPFEVYSSFSGIVPGDVCIRCELVSFVYSDESDPVLVKPCTYITSKEYAEIFSFLSEELSGSVLRFVHTEKCCLVWKNGDTEGCHFTRPHSSGTPYDNALPHGDISAPFIKLIEKSHELLSDHPVNTLRRSDGREEISALWFTEAGEMPDIHMAADVFSKFSFVSMDPAVSGLCLAAGMKRFSSVEEALDYSERTVEGIILDLDFSDNTVSLLEDTDRNIIPELKKLAGSDGGILILSLPSAAETVSVCPPLPYLLYKPDVIPGQNTGSFTERAAFDSGVFVPDAHKLLKRLLQS